jgi:hypothetical protein|tara:strand:- start:2 stop:196 length:195 start_codon:yes stop_codon:yes gene_type:complete
MAKTALDDTQLPYTIEELVVLLDSTYPAVPPSLSDNDREVWFKAGQTSVVTWLKELTNRAQDSN